MRITGIIWLEEVVEKLRRKHGVEPDEVEEALEGRSRIRRIEAGKVKGEDLYSANGESLERTVPIGLVHPQGDR